MRGKGYLDYVKYFGLSNRDGKTLDDSHKEIIRLDLHFERPLEVWIRALIRGCHTCCNHCVNDFT